jgi:SpoVK/Ycf46/Vps4 family AAA+-type ATPase
MGGGDSDREGGAPEAALEKLGVRVYNSSGTSDDDSADQLDWDCMAGYEEVKGEIDDTLILALQNPEAYDRVARSTRKRYETNRPRAVLFEGPPGTGKTLCARIIASRAGLPMVHLPVESIMSKWFGGSENKLAQIFEACDKLGDGKGAILFIDEVDALATSRDSGNMHEATRRILSVLLSKVEGFASERRTTLICATNRRQDLDSALLSRFDLSLRFDVPDTGARAKKIGRYAQQLSPAELGRLAAQSEGMSCRDIKEVCGNAERKWASKILKKLVTDDAPPLAEYSRCLDVRAGAGGGNAVADVV